MKRSIRKTVSILLCILLALGAMGVNVLAEQVVQHSEACYETAAGTSAVYLGKVTYKGKTLRYIYSAGFSRTAGSVQTLENVLSQTGDETWASLLYPLQEEADGKGIAICSDVTKTALMDETWVSAAAAGQACNANTNVSSQNTRNLYDADAGAAQYMDQLAADRANAVTSPLPVNKSFITYIHSTSTTNVYYTKEGDLVTKHVDDDITYQCEEVTVYVTEASLSDKPKETVNIVKEQGEVTKKSRVYLGEVILNGESTLTYIYSADVDNHATAGLGRLYTALITADKTAFAALLNEETCLSLTDAETPGTGLKLCSDPAFTDLMDENWTSASGAAKKCFPDNHAAGVTRDLMQNADAGFKAASDAQAAGITYPLYDNNVPAETADRLIGILGSSSVDTVTYTVIDGELVKAIDRSMYYDCELVTVYYTTVHLTAQPPEVALGDVDGKDGVNAADARLALRCAVGLENYEKGSREYLACDVTLDGNVNAEDARLILRKAVGFEDPEWGKAKS